MHTHPEQQSNTKRFGPTMAATAKLHEMCSKMNWKVAFTTQEQGLPHCRTFHVTAALSGDSLPDNVEATGTGTTVKGAKDSACTQLLVHQDVKIALTQGGVTLPTNYKGKLGEAMQRALADYKRQPEDASDIFVPNYNAEHTGPPHSRVFSATVTIKLPQAQEILTRGSARSKKEAEQEAAAEALKDPILTPYMSNKNITTALNALTEGLKDMPLASKPVATSTATTTANATATTASAPATASATTAKSISKA